MEDTSIVTFQVELYNDGSFFRQNTVDHFMGNFSNFIDAESNIKRWRNVDWEKETGGEK